MTATIIPAAWGAVLSTGLALLNLYDRTRARPIIRAHVTMASRRALEEPRFVAASVRTGRYDDEEVREFYVEFRVENYGAKPLSLLHIYIETAKNLAYITPEGLPVVLEGQTAATFEVQKEHFDTLDSETRERRKPEIREIGFVDGLDRRYPVPKRRLQDLLDRSLALPTTMAVYVRKEHPENRVLAFQVVNPAIIKSRSTKKFNFLRNRLLFWRSTA
jgi:hypothetical protein